VSKIKIWPKKKKVQPDLKEAEKFPEVKA